MLKTSVIAFAILHLVASVAAQCLTANDQRLYDQGTAQKTLFQGQQDFALKMFKELNRQHPSDNVFFSPYSTYHALLLAYFISRNKTEKSLKTALRIPEANDKVDVYQAYKYEKFKRNLPRTNTDAYEFDSANKVYLATQIQTQKCMEDILIDEIERVDFQANAEAARVHINQWVANKTRNEIKDLLKPGMVTKDSNLILANAAYFKGKWVSQFSKESTKPSVFYLSETEKKLVDMMHQQGTFRHDISEELGAHILEMPYIGDDISMFILLPPYVNGLGIDNVLSRLNSTTLENVVEKGSMRAKNVTVFMPRFTIEKTYSLKPVLESIGVGDLFTTESDLSGLVTNGTVNLGDAQHKVKVVVDEEGTTAAAATVIFTFRTSRPVEPIVFNCNHPFVYFIYDHSAEAILFLGVYRKPETA